LRHPGTEIEYADRHSLKLCQGCFEVFHPMIEGADPRQICSAIVSGVTFVEMVRAADPRHRNDFTDGLKGIWDPMMRVCA